MELFTIIVNEFQPLSIVLKSFILDAAGVEHYEFSNTKSSGMHSSKNGSVIPKWTNKLNVNVLLT